MARKPKAPSAPAADPAAPALSPGDMILVPQGASLEAVASAADRVAKATRPPHHQPFAVPVAAPEEPVARAVETMNWDSALQLLQAGTRMSRLEWAKGRWLGMSRFGGDLVWCLPLAFSAGPGAEDLAATDWFVVE